jgi:hypothetical protein
MNCIKKGAGLDSNTFSTNAMIFVGVLGLLPEYSITTDRPISVIIQRNNNKQKKKYFIKQNGFWQTQKMDKFIPHSGMFLKNVQDLESYKNKRILLPTCTYTGTRTPL